MPAKKNIIDLDSLDPETRTKVERVISPQNKMVTCKFNLHDIALWQIKADSANLDLTSWMRTTLNESARSPVPDNRTDAQREHDAALRTISLSRRFNANEYDTWVAAAGEESMTSWIERMLNLAAGKKGRK